MKHGAQKTPAHPIQQVQDRQNRVVQEYARAG